MHGRCSALSAEGLAHGKCSVSVSLGCLWEQQGPVGAPHPKEVPSSHSEQDGCRGVAGLEAEPGRVRSEISQEEKRAGS